MNKKPLDPVTPAEWQTAVDTAEGALCIDSARQYGLVTGGPEVNVERCNAILRLGKNEGITPSTDAVERFIDDLMARQRRNDARRTAARKKNSHAGKINQQNSAKPT